MRSFFLLLAVGVASAIELSPANWDEQTAGKTVFLKFFAPWCGHCKKIKPDWDKLMVEYKDSKTVLVADVDCTAEGKPLCDSNGVKGFPTIKSGDPASLDDYQGGRDMAALQAHAAGLKPLCSPMNMDLCDEEGKAAIEKVQGMSDDEIDAAIKEGEKKLEDAETTFKTELEKLQNRYQELQKEKEDTIAEVKASGLGLLKSVKAAKGKKAASSAKEDL